MSDRQGIVFQDVVVFCFINWIYGVLPLFILLELLPSDMADAIWGVGDTTIITFLWRVVMAIAVGAPIGIKFNDGVREIWDRFTS
jgi:hypothetical protein